MSNINKLDGISAVEDLTDAAAAVVEGGGSVGGPLLEFDAFFPTKPFSVSRGGSVEFTSSTREGGFGFGDFTATLINLRTNRTTTPKTVAVGRQGRASWSNVRGGIYGVDLRDSKDGLAVTGNYIVSFT